MKFGLISDIHYASKPEAGNNRFYRQSLDKTKKAIRKFNSKKVDFMVILGDTIDAVNRETDLINLKKIVNILNEFNGEIYFVLGNHDLETLSKKSFLKNVCNSQKHSTKYVFTKDDYYFIVLDTNYRGDATEYKQGNFSWQNTYLPEDQIQWLESKLNLAINKDKYVIIFVHQLLDRDNSHGINNSEKVREVIEKKKNILTVFQGHFHQGDYNKINDIHYFTIPAMVEGEFIDNNSKENNSFAIVNLFEERVSIEVYGKNDYYYIINNQRRDKI